MEGSPLEISLINLVPRTGARIGWVGVTNEVNGSGSGVGRLGRTFQVSRGTAGDSSQRYCKVQLSGPPNTKREMERGDLLAMRSRNNCLELQYAKAADALGSVTRGDGSAHWLRELPTSGEHKIPGWHDRSPARNAQCETRHPLQSNLRQLIRNASITALLYHAIATCERLCVIIIVVT